MPAYEIAYNPKMHALTDGLETNIVADRHAVHGRFVVFYKDGETVLQIAANLVLQVKTSS